MRLRRFFFCIIYSLTSYFSLPFHLQFKDDHFLSFPNFIVNFSCLFLLLYSDNLKVCPINFSESAAESKVCFFFIESFNLVVIKLKLATITMRRRKQRVFSLFTCRCISVCQIYWELWHTFVSISSFHGFVFPVSLCITECQLFTLCGVALSQPCTSCFTLEASCQGEIQPLQTHWPVDYIIHHRDVPVHPTHTYTNGFESNSMQGSGRTDRNQHTEQLFFLQVWISFINVWVCVHWEALVLSYCSAVVVIINVCWQVFISCSQ